MSYDPKRVGGAVGTQTYTTVTVVIRSRLEPEYEPTDVLTRITLDNVLFLAAEQGVTTHAQELGAEPD